MREHSKGDWNEKTTTHNCRHETNEVYVVMTNNQLSIFRNHNQSFGEGRISLLLAFHPASPLTGRATVAGSASFHNPSPTNSTNPKILLTTVFPSRLFLPSRLPLLILSQYSQSFPCALICPPSVLSGNHSAVRCTVAGILPSLDGGVMEMMPLSANLVYAFRRVSRLTASRYEISPCAYKVLPSLCA